MTSNNSGKADDAKASTNTYTYINKPIMEENFVFDDKSGKFFMYADVVKRLTDNHKIEVHSVDGEDGKPVSLNIKTTLLSDDVRFPKNSPKGTETYLKIDYNHVRPEDLYYIVDKMIRVAPSARTSDDTPGETLYIASMNNGKFQYLTKKGYDNINYDFNKIK